MPELKKLTLLHSNDMHGDFLAEKIDDTLVGGVSRLSGYISSVRQEEKNVLYCVAGDMFRGSVIDSEYQGFSTIDIMNVLSPDIVTIGNHEADYGIAHLLFIEKCARFPIINANLEIRTNHVKLFRPYKILKIDGMKILFIGILTEQVLAQAKKDGLLGTFVNVSDAAEEIGRICNAYRSTDIDLTVLLTHIGFEEDQKLAEQLDPNWGIDLIIGGHSHTLPEEPMVVNGIPIVQAGTGTDQIGRFDLVVNTDTNSLESYEWKAVPINSDTCPKDTHMSRLIYSYKSQTDEKYNRPVTRFRKMLTHPRRNMETELGNLAADALKDSLHVDIMLLGSGSVRSKELGDVVLFSDFSECFPFQDNVYMNVVTGAQFRRMMLYMLRDDTLAGGHTEFYQVSRGVKMVYDPAAHSFLEFSFEGKPIADEDRLTVALQKYHQLNMFDSFNITPEEVAENQRPIVIATSDADVIEAYFTDHQHLDSAVEGRITIL